MADRSVEGQIVWQTTGMCSPTIRVRGLQKVSQGNGGYGRPLGGQPNNLFPEMIYPMVNGGVEEKNNMADNGMLIEISKLCKDGRDFFCIQNKFLIRFFELGLF